MSSAPWIWPMMMSPFALGVCATDIEARKVCLPLAPAFQFCRLTSSVRGCLEFGVVVPSTGAQNLRPPLLSLVRYGAEGFAGLTLAAVPLSLAVGSVSFQPARPIGPRGARLVGGLGLGVTGFGVITLGAAGGGAGGAATGGTCSGRAIPSQSPPPIRASTTDAVTRRRGPNDGVSPSWTAGRARA